MGLETGKSKSNADRFSEVEKDMKAESHHGPTGLDILWGLFYSFIFSSPIHSFLSFSYIFIVCTYYLNIFNNIFLVKRNQLLKCHHQHHHF